MYKFISKREDVSIEYTITSDQIDCTWMSLVADFVCFLRCNGFIIDRDIESSIFEKIETELTEEK